MRSVLICIYAASVQCFAPPALRSVVRVRTGEQGCRSTLGSTTAIRAKENGGGGASELTREGKLIVSILIDLIGMSTYLLPGRGRGCGCRLGASVRRAHLLALRLGHLRRRWLRGGDSARPGLRADGDDRLVSDAVRRGPKRIGEKVTPEAAREKESRATPRRRGSTSV